MIIYIVKIFILCNERQILLYKCERNIVFRYLTKLLRNFKYKKIHIFYELNNNYILRSKYFQYSIVYVKKLS